MRRLLRDQVDAVEVQAARAAVVVQELNGARFIEQGQRAQTKRSVARVRAAGDAAQLVGEYDAGPSKDPACRLAVPLAGR